MILEKILGLLTVRENLARSGRNFTALENEVNAHGEQINSLNAQLGTIETQTILENYLSAHSIPSTAKRGKLDVKLKGLSAVNSVKNGNFADGTNGWTKNNIVVTDLGDVLQIEFISTTNEYLLQYVAINNTDKYFTYAKVKSLVDTVTFGFTGNTITHSGSGNFEELYKISYSRTNSNLAFATATLGTIEVDKNAGVFAINMTALGIEEYTEEQMLAMVRNGYFDGLQGATNIEVQSIGKNLFDGEMETGSISNITGENSALASTVRSKNYTVLKPNTTYSVSQHGNNKAVNYKFYDNSKQLLSYGTAYTFTTPDNAYYLRFAYGSGYEDIEELQLEEGTIATPYEPYKSTEVTYKTLDGQPITLHRVPNSVYDEISYDGKNIKRNAEYTLQSSDIKSIANGTNVQYMTVSLTTFPNIASQTVSTIEGKLIVNGFSEVVSVVSSTIPYVFATNTADLYLGVPLNTYADLTQARTALAGTKIIYELAQPQILDTNATPLIAEPNGHVFITSEGTQPSNELSYPINLGAVVDGLLDGQKQHSELLISQNTINLDFDLRITALEP